MNPSTNPFRRVGTLGCALGLLTFSVGGQRALAAAGDAGESTAATAAAARPRPVDLRLDDRAAARLAMAEGAAQEADTEKPRPMGDEPTVTVTKRNPGDK